MVFCAGVSAECLSASVYSSEQLLDVFSSTLRVRGREEIVQ